MCSSVFATDYSCNPVYQFKSSSIQVGHINAFIDKIKTDYQYKFPLVSNMSDFDCSLFSDYGFSVNDVTGLFFSCGDTGSTYWIYFNVIYNISPYCVFIYDLPSNYNGFGAQVSSSSADVFPSNSGCISFGYNCLNEGNRWSFIDSKFSRNNAGTLGHCSFTDYVLFSTTPIASRDYFTQVYNAVGYTNYTKQENFPLLVTEPPVTEPPVTEPPVTEPPVTEPPVTEPPVTTYITGLPTDDVHEYLRDYPIRPTMLEYLRDGITVVIRVIIAIWALRKAWKFLKKNLKDA